MNWMIVSHFQLHVQTPGQMCVIAFSIMLWYHALEGHEFCKWCGQIIFGWKLELEKVLDLWQKCPAFRIWILFGFYCPEPKNQKIRDLNLCEKDIWALDLCKVSNGNELMGSDRIHLCAVFSFGTTKLEES